MGNDVLKADNTDTLNVTSSWVGGVVPGTSKIAVWNSTVTAANTTVLGADMTWSGIKILDPVGLVTINAGNTLTLGAASVDLDLSAATADLTLNCPLVMDAQNVWDVAANRTLTVAGAVSGTFSVTKQGLGTAIFSGGGSYPSLNLLGTNKLGATDGLSTTAAVTIGVNGVATLDLAGFNQTLVSIARGDSAATITNTATASDSTLTLTGTSSYPNAINDKNVSGSRIGLIVNGGSLALSSAMTFSGGTTIKKGRLIANNSNTSMGKGTVTLGDSTGSEDATLDLTDRTWANAITVASGNSGISTLTNRNSTLTGLITLDKSLAVDSSSVLAGNSLVISGNIAGTGGLTIRNFMSTAGTNAVVLSGSNTFSGGLTLSLGLLHLNSTNALGATSGLFTINAGKLDNSSGAALTNANNNAMKWNGGFTFNGTANLHLGNGDVDLGTGARTVTVVANTLTIGGAITNGGSLTKLGAGTLTILGANTYTGLTTVSNGTLALSGAGSLASPAIVVAGGATFSVSGLSSPPFALGTGQTLANSGTTTANVAGDVSAGSGTVTLSYVPGTPSFTTSGTLTLASGTTFSVDNTGAQLGHGDHKLIAKSGAGAVAGLPGTYTIAGGGAATPHSLRIVAGELYLTVNTPPEARSLSFGVAQGDAASLTVIDGKHPPTDVDSDTLTVTAVGSVSPPAAGSASFTSSEVTFAAANDYSGTATFSYTVSDGYGGSDTKLVTVTIASASSGANLQAPVFHTPGVATLNGFGIPGRTYQLQYSESLNPVNWQDVSGTGATAAAASDGKLILVDVNANGSGRYYRTR